MSDNKSTNPFGHKVDRIAEKEADAAHYDEITRKEYEQPFLDSAAMAIMGGLLNGYKHRDHELVEDRAKVSYDLAEILLAEKKKRYS